MTLLLLPNTLPRPPLHIAPATFAHLLATLTPFPSNSNPHLNCFQTPDLGLGLGVNLTFAWDNSNNNNNYNSNNNENPHLNFLGLRDKGQGVGSGVRGQGKKDQGIRESRELYIKVFWDPGFQGSRDKA